MSYAGTAGGSAAAEAARLRAQAEELAKAADAWERGDQGERMTAALLAKLPPAYLVLHDLGLPGSRANIDHLVIGPTGVVMIDSKNFSHRVTANKGTLWTGPHPLTKNLETACWEARAAEAAIANGTPGHAVSVTPVMCIHGTSVPEGLLVGGVRVVAGRALLPLLLRSPAQLTGDEALQIADAARVAMPPLVADSGAPEVVERERRVRRVVLPPTPLTRGWRAPKAAPRRRTRPVGRSLGRRAGVALGLLVARLLVVLIGTVVAGLLIYGFMTTVIKSAGEAATKNSPVAPAAAPPTGPVNVADAHFSCPRSGAGWTLALPSVDPTSQEVDWSLAPEGPWARASGSVVNGIGPGAKVFVRGKARGASDDTLSMAMHAAPSRAC